MNGSGRRVAARVAWRWLLALAAGCAAAMIIIGTAACAVGLGRGESDLRSAAAEVPMRPGQVFRDCEDCPGMVVVPAWEGRDAVAFG